jgi:hypothetical protein
MCDCNWTGQLDGGEVETEVLRPRFEAGGRGAHPQIWRKANGAREIRLGANDPCSCCAVFRSRRSTRAKFGFSLFLPRTSGLEPQTLGLELTRKFGGRRTVPGKFGSGRTTLVRAAPFFADGVSHAPNLTLPASCLEPRASSLKPLRILTLLPTESLPGLELRGCLPGFPGPMRMGPRGRRKNSGRPSMGPCSTCRRIPCRPRKSQCPGQ